MPNGITLPHLMRSKPVMESGQPSSFRHTRRTTDNSITAPAELYRFASDNIKGIWILWLAAEDVKPIGKD